MCRSTTRKLDSRKDYGANRAKTDVSFVDTTNPNFIKVGLKYGTFYLIFKSVFDQTHDLQQIHDIVD